MYIQKRSIGLCIVLSLVTCGIYSLYWLYKMAEDINTLKQEPGATSPGMVLVLSIVTCGIYTIYWFYKAGETLDNINFMQGLPTGNKAILYMLLALFGLSIVSYCLVQNDLNNQADGGMGDRFGGYGNQGGYGNPYGGYQNPNQYGGPNGYNNQYGGQNGYNNQYGGQNGYNNQYGGQNGYNNQYGGQNGYNNQGYNVQNSYGTQDSYGGYGTQNTYSDSNPFITPQQTQEPEKDPFAAQNSYLTPPESPFVPYPDEEPSSGSMMDDMKGYSDDSEL